MKDPTSPDSERMFELLRQQIDFLVRRPMSIGLDLPKWLEALDEEVERAERRDYDPSLMDDDVVAQDALIPLDKLREEIAAMPRYQ